MFFDEEISSHFRTIDNVVVVVVDNLWMLFLLVEELLVSLY